MDDGLMMKEYRKTYRKILPMLHFNARAYDHLCKAQGDILRFEAAVLCERLISTMREDNKPEAIYAIIERMNIPSRTPSSVYQSIRSYIINGVFVGFNLNRGKLSRMCPQ